jgi:hypothetical protein
MGDHEASGPISPVPQVSTCIQLARSLGTFVALFSQARGLCLESSSSGTWLSHAPTTRPHPTFPVVSGFRWGLPCLLSTPLRSQQEISRVHHEGLQRHAVGGVLLNTPSPLWGSPIFLQGRVRLTWSPITDHPRPSSLVLTVHTTALQARRADIISKVCQGPRFGG